MFTQGQYYKCGKGVYTISVLKQIPLAILGIIVLFLIKAFFPHVLWYAIILFCAYILGTLAEAWYTYSSHVFMLDEYALHIRSGILNRNEIAIPYRQVQDVSLNESYLQRMFGVAELSILTAGHEDTKDEKASADFPLIDKSYALALQEELSKRSSVQQVTGDTEKLN
jgi:uncharacterized membrane protein YdbT with pleckstrin-like domain